MKNIHSIFIIILILFVGFKTSGCIKNGTNNAISKTATDKLTEQKKNIEIVNTNKSFIGNYDGKAVMLNLNNYKADSIAGFFYYYKETNPYENIIYLKGTLKNDELFLQNSDAISLNGKIKPETFDGEILINEIKG